MPTTHLATTLEEALAELPVLDPHTHLVGGKLGARGLHDVLLYHMVISDLYSAGCPNGSRLTEYPGWASPEEARSRIEEALPFLPKIRNTSTYWGLQIILRDLYDWKEPISADNWAGLDARVRERADDRAWHHDILDRLNIRRSCTELARREGGEDDERLQYVLEWAFFCRCQWGEYDTALYELERCWGKTPESPAPIGSGERPPTEQTIRSLDDVHAAIQHYVAAIPYDEIVSVATHVSTDLDYRPRSDGEMEAALARRAHAGAIERDVYAAYIHEAFLSALEVQTPSPVLQFSLAAEALPYETGSRVSQHTIAQLAEMIARHPRIHFQCFLASRHANQSLCTLARGLPNFSLIGYWWHNFFPDTIRKVMAERLDMLPMNRQIGFFSDAYCLEWTYGKAIIVRKQMARVLAEKIRQGQYSFDDAVAIAREVLFDTPRELLRMVPRSD